MYESAKNQLAFIFVAVVAGTKQDSRATAIHNRDDRDKIAEVRVGVCYTRGAEILALRIKVKITGKIVRLIVRHDVAPRSFRKIDSSQIRLRPAMNPLLKLRRHAGGATPATAASRDIACTCQRLPTSTVDSLCTWQPQVRLG